MIRKTTLEEQAWRSYYLKSQNFVLRSFLIQVFQEVILILEYEKLAWYNHTIYLALNLWSIYFFDLQIKAWRKGATVQAFW